MSKKIFLTIKLRKLIFSTIIIICVTAFSAHSQQITKMNMDTSNVKEKSMKYVQNMEMLPMPFFTHMGIPLDVGTYNVRAAILPTKGEGENNTEFNVQFATGLSKTVGLQIGAQGSFASPTIEAMFQFLVWKSKNGMNGISPIIEFEFPLSKEASRKVYTLVGFSTTFSNSNIAFNQVLHYSPLEDLAEGSFLFVIKLSKSVFLVSELSGVTEKEANPIFNLLSGVKIKLNKNFLIGIGYQQPITTNREFSSQYIFQPDLMFHK